MMPFSPWYRAHKISSQVLGRLLPRACLLCDAPADHKPLCQHCEGALPGAALARCPCCALPLHTHTHTHTHSEPNRPSNCPYHAHFSPALDEIICLADYAPPLDQVLGSLKFGQQASLGRALGELLMQKAASMKDQPLQGLDALIPIPLSGPRLAERGFNQSYQIARGMRALPGNQAPPIQTGWLRRIRHTAPQSTLAANERSQNLLGAFEASPATRYKQLALVDDVMTTGATLLAAAEALKAAGAARVIALVVTRTP